MRPSGALGGNGSIKANRNTFLLTTTMSTVNGCLFPFLSFLPFLRKGPA